MGAATEPNLVEFGRFVRDRRMSLNLTQTQLAQRLGWVQERVSLIENAKYGLPSLPALVRIAEALESPLSSLLEAVGYGAMTPADPTPGTPPANVALQYALQQLLSIEANTLNEALTEAADVVGQAMGADKVDAFMHNPETATLVALGTSHTEMGRKQKQLGLDHMPIANGGRTVEVFKTGQPYYTGRAEDDPNVTTGIVRSLGVRTLLVQPLTINNEIQGVLSAASAEYERFGLEERQFFEAAARWVAMIARRSELMESVARAAVEEARRLAAEELITLLAHDLGNALTPIKGRLQMIERRSRREERDRDLSDVQEISRSVNRVQRMVSELLDVSRLDRGIFFISPEAVDLVALVEDVKAQFLPVWPHIVTHSPEELVVQADGGRITQAIENLIANATNHAPEGSPIRITLATDDGIDGRTAILTVHDDGPGIPLDMLPRIFTRFASGPQSNGLGLGLYLARSIVEAHGGSVTVDSSSGPGTTFRLSLPMSQ